MRSTIPYCQSSTSSKRLRRSKCPFDVLSPNPKCSMCGFWRGHFKSFYLSASQLSTSCVRWVQGERWEGRLGSWEAWCRWVLWSHEGSIEHRLLWLVFTGSCSWRSGSRSHCFHPASVALNTIMKMSLDTKYKTYNFHRTLWKCTQLPWQSVFRKCCPTYK